MDRRVARAGGRLRRLANGAPNRLVSGAAVHRRVAVRRARTIVSGFVLMAVPRRPPIRRILTDY